MEKWFSEEVKVPGKLCRYHYNQCNNYMKAQEVQSPTSVKQR